ncbi:MAG: uncharacterized protein K0R21_333 [Anaerocolumna sp.]|jgi:hypothetical protein|nr:uncharacterized protein [Anaerocolumna sp.]
MNINKYSTSDSYDYENGWYLTSDVKRIGKILAHYELYKRIVDLPGDVLELGVFKGTSLIRFASFRELLENSNSRKIVGFDVWGKFPETNFEEDKDMRQNYIDITKDFLPLDDFKKSLDYKKLPNVELIQGDICNTVPSYVKNFPALKISLLHIDTDIYEPAKVALEYLWDKVVKGGVVIFDDYAVFPGETKAVDDFFRDKDVEIKKFSFSHNIPSYIIKK